MTPNVTSDPRDVTETTLGGLAVGAVAVVALLANVSLFAVVLTSRQLRNESNVLILSLSLADLLVSAVSMPLTTATIVFGTWTFTRTTCVTVGFLNMLTFTASVQSLAVISVNRYFKICRPSRYLDIYTYQNVLGMCLGVWLISGLVSMPPILGWAAYSYLPNSYICFCEWGKSASYAFFMISFCFCLPCSAMTFCNVGILRAYLNSKKAVDSFVDKTPGGDQAAATSLHHDTQIVSDKKELPELKLEKEVECLNSHKALIINDNLGTSDKNQVNEIPLSSSNNLRFSVEVKKPDNYHYSCSDRSLISPDLTKDYLLFVQPSDVESGVISDTFHISRGSIRVEAEITQAETRRAEDGRIMEGDVKSEAAPSHLKLAECTQTDVDDKMVQLETTGNMAPIASKIGVPVTMSSGLNAVNILPLKPSNSTTSSSLEIINVSAHDDHSSKLQHHLKSEEFANANISIETKTLQKHLFTRHPTSCKIHFYRNRKRQRQKCKNVTNSATVKSDDCLGKAIKELGCSKIDQCASVNQMSGTGVFRNSVNMKKSKFICSRSSVELDFLLGNSLTQRLRGNKQSGSVKRVVFSLVNNCVESLKDSDQYRIKHLCQLFKKGETTSNTNVCQRKKNTNRKWKRNRISPLQKKGIVFNNKIHCNHHRSESLLEMDDYKFDYFGNKDMKNETASMSLSNTISCSEYPIDVAETGNIVVLQPIEKEGTINRECFTDPDSSSLKKCFLTERSTTSLLEKNVTKMAEETITQRLPLPPFTFNAGKSLLSVPHEEKNVHESAPERKCTFSKKSSVRSKSKSERRRAEEFQLAGSLLVVILLFVVCWFPYCISMFVVVFSPERSSKGLDLTSLCLGYFNSCLNPIVYGVMNKKFKMAYRRMLLPWLRPCRFRKSLNFAARSSKRSRVENVTLATVTST